MRFLARPRPRRPCCRRHHRNVTRILEGDRSQKLNKRAPFLRNQVGITAHLEEPGKPVVRLDGHQLEGGRAVLEVPVDADDDVIKHLALADTNVMRFTQDKTIRKIIVVPNKLVNIVAPN